MGDGPTGYIRGLSVRKTPTGVMRTLLVVSGNIPLHDEVVGFCEYGCVLSSCYRPVWREFSFRKSGRF